MLLDNKVDDLIPTGSDSLSDFDFCWSNGAFVIW